MTHTLYSSLSTPELRYCPRCCRTTPHLLSTASFRIELMRSNTTTEQLLGLVAFLDLERAEIIRYVRRLIEFVRTGPAIRKCFRAVFSGRRSGWWVGIWWPRRRCSIVGYYYVLWETCQSGAVRAVIRLLSRKQLGPTLPDATAPSSTVYTPIKFYQFLSVNESHWWQGFPEWRCTDIDV